MAKPSHISFEPSDLTSTANPLNRYPHLKFGFFANSKAADDNVTATSSKICKPTTSAPAPIESPAPESEPSTFAVATNLDTAPNPSDDPKSHLERPTYCSSNMAEPPTKRAKRTDSAAIQGIPPETPDTKTIETEKTKTVGSMGAKTGPEGRDRGQGIEDGIETGSGGEIAADLGIGKERAR
ncbi:MAG: hypothetical protein Q9204_008621 [Flavoplaca sp. TL-2023a]